jgi:hypothetical protein
MGSISAAASSIKNPLTFHPGSTLRARLNKAFIHLDTSGFAELRVITHATGSACCLESNTRSVHKGYCNSTDHDINIPSTNFSIGMSVHNEVLTLSLFIPNVESAAIRLRWPKRIICCNCHSV